jgi:hypothetical protein
LEQMAKFVHFIPQYSQLPSPTFDHTRVARVGHFARAFGRRRG